MRTFCAALITLVAAGAAFTGGAFADASGFSESQSPDDQLFHIDVAVSHQAIGTIKVSLPGIAARFDPAQPIDAAGYSCSVSASRYGEPGTGFVCSTDGTQSGSVTVHLVAQDCYAPPPEGSAQPAVADVWPTPGDPGTQPQASFQLYGDPGCGGGGGQLSVDVVTPARCVVPKLGKLTLLRATRKLAGAGCRRGKIVRVFSKTIRKGLVINQSARPGRKLELNAKVNLTVSLGSKH